MKINQASRRYQGPACSGGDRSAAQIRTIVVHQTAGSFNSAAGVASYLQRRPDGSVHVIVDDTTTFIGAGDRTICCGAAGFNTNALHLELCGPVGPIRKWLGHGPTLERGAYAVVRWANKWNIDLEYLTIRDLKAGKRDGWTYHRTVTMSGVATTTHTDALRGLANVRFKGYLRKYSRALEGKAPPWDEVG